MAGDVLAGLLDLRQVHQDHLRSVAVVLLAPDNLSSVQYYIDLVPRVVAGIDYPIFLGHYLEVDLVRPIAKFEEVDVHPMIDDVDVDSPKDCLVAGGVRLSPMASIGADARPMLAEVDIPGSKPG
jgi:hypothetical protein